MAPARRARDRALDARRRRLARRHGRPRGRARAPGRRSTHVLPIAAPAATGPMAIAWNHLQVELIERLGLDGLALARQLAMTTYRSEADFDERFGRDGRARRPALDRQLPRPPGPQARRPVRPRPPTGSSRAPWTATTSASAGAASTARFARLAAAGTRLTGVGIQDDILYGPRQVQRARRRGQRPPVSTRATARSARPRATTRSSSSGTSSRTIIGEALAGLIAPRAR